jgi:signal transduction histidine kinase
LGLTLIATPRPELLPGYLGLHGAYLLLFTVVFWRPTLRPAALHLCFMMQSAIVFMIVSLNPDMGVVTALIPLLAYQAALVFTGSIRWYWVGGLALLTAGPLMFYLGALTGLARGLLPMIGVVVLAAYVVVMQEIESARLTSQELLGELQEKHRQLQTYADQVEELAAIEERSRLARALHDSVSQTLFSILLNIRSAQIVLKQDPARLKPHLTQLQELAQDALGQMRGLIARWRIPGD